MRHRFFASLISTALALGLVLQCTGCNTLADLTDPRTAYTCYGGTRRAVKNLDWSGGGELSGLKLIAAPLYPFLVVDVGLSATADTLLLPVAWLNAGRVERKAEREARLARAAERMLVAQPSESRAQDALRSIARAQRKVKRPWQEFSSGLRYAGSLSEFERHVGPEIADGEFGGYRLELQRSMHLPTLRWMAVANPIDPEAGARSFAVDARGEVYASDETYELNGACLIQRGTQVKSER